MIEIIKNIDKVPKSLVPAFADLFAGSSIPTTAKTTHKKRMKVIDGKKYIDEKAFNDRYKYADIRVILTGLYKNKCAYCEQKIERYSVEHYRPKSIYYWLAFSWDNLILACPTCNENKGKDFEITGSKVNFDNTETNIRNINKSSTSYNDVELPKMINPETINPLGFISFNRTGLITSDDDRFSYTIGKCEIDRTYLNDERRKLLNIFERDIQSALVENQTLSAQQMEISIIVRKFIRDSEDKELQYLAFRRFSITSGWLNEIVKELN